MTTRLVVTAWWCLLQLVPTAMAMMLVPSQVTRRTGVAVPRARPRVLEAALQAMDAEEDSSGEGAGGIGESDAMPEDTDAVSSGGSDDEQAASASASASAARTKGKAAPPASKRRRRGKGKGPSHKINSNKKSSHQMVGIRPNCEWRSGACARRRTSAITARTTKTRLQTTPHDSSCSHLATCIGHQLFTAVGLQEHDTSALSTILPAT